MVDIVIMKRRTNNQINNITTRPGGAFLSSDVLRFSRPATFLLSKKIQQ